MGKKSAIPESDWDLIRTEYISSSISIRELAEKHDCSFEAIQKRSIRDGWLDQRHKLSAEVLAKADAEIVERRVKELNEFNEQDMLLFRLGISGSCFKHVYYCKRTEKFKAVFVKPEDMIVPWNASCMASTERFTHRYFESNATFKRNKTSGYYSGSEIVKPSSEDVNEVRAVELKSQGTTPNAIADVNQHEILKCHCTLEIEGGYDYPMEYIVWVEKQSQEVIRVQRNWKPEDETQQRVVRYAHYKCFSGLGFYGLGFYHLMGGSIDALTDMLRLIIDGSMEASFGGGFMSDEAKIDLVRGQVTKGKDGKRPPPRTFRKIRASPEDLAKAFFVPPSKEPTPMLLSAMQYVDGGVSDFSGINGVLSGDSKAVNMPVGTVLALIEQGSTQFSAVFQRLHSAQTQEFSMLSDVILENIPDNGYPYSTKDGDSYIMASDFDERIDIIPVSNPETASKSHRIMKANALTEMSGKFQGLLEPKWVMTQALEAMNIEVPEEAWTQAPQPDPMQQAELEKMQVETQGKAIDNENTLQVGGARLFNPLSASNITGLGAFKFAGNANIRTLLSSGFGFDFRALQVGTSFSVSIAGATFNNAPSWGGSGTATVQCIGAYFGNSDRTVQVWLNNATATPSHWFTLDGGTTWGQIK